MPDDSELRNQCADVQAVLGLDDKLWEGKFGNRDGLCGFVQAHQQKNLLKGMITAYADIAHREKPIIGLQLYARSRANELRSQLAQQKNKNE